MTGSGRDPDRMPYRAGGCQTPETAASCRLPESARRHGDRTGAPVQQKKNRFAMKPLDSTLRLVVLLVPCSILCLPASTTVAGYVALRMTANTSHFEGGAGYAWLWLTILLSCAFYALGIGICVLMRKKAALLAVVAVVFAALSVPTCKAVNDLLH